MKKLEGLGKSLSKDEQRKISGGGAMVCGCAGATNHNDVFFCVGDITRCNLAAARYCGGDMACTGANR